jgi:metal-responsive CopG/Arc/MetJ family transcriptional regulator
MHMRMHINLEDQLVQEIDAVAGSRGRSAFIRDAISREIDRRRRWTAFERAAGAAPAFASHLPAEWVREGRREDPRRMR